MPSRLSAVLVTAALLFGCSPPVDDATRISRAADFEQEGRYRGAMIELKNVLKENPSNAEARFALARISLALGDPAGAEKDLRRARELGAPPEPMLETLARAYLGLGEPQRVLDEIDPDLAEDAATQATLTALLGHALAADQRPEEARDRYEAALALDAASAEARMGLARLAAALGDDAAAQAYLREAVELHPDAVVARLDLGRSLLRTRDNADAEQVLLQGLQLPEARHMGANRISLLVTLAEVQLALGELDESSETIKLLAQLVPKHPMTSFLRARLAFDQGDFEAARDDVASVLAQAPRFPPALLLQGALNLQAGEFAQAEMHLKRALAQDPNNLRAVQMLGQAQMQLDRPDRAIDTLLPALSESEDGLLLAMLGQASLRSGDQQAGLDFLERGARSDPDNTALQLELAAGYLSAGQPERAIALLETLSDEVDVSRRDLLMTLALVRTGDFDGARARVGALAADNPTDAALEVLRGSVEHSAGDTDRARQHFERALELDAGHTSAVIGLARLDVQDGQQDRGYARLETFLDVAPGDVAVLTALARMDEAAGNGDRAFERLEIARAANPDALQPRLLLARGYNSRRNFAAALEVAGEATKLEPDSATGHTAMGLAYMGTRSHEQALASFRRAVSAAPESPDALVNLARAEIALDRPSQARDTVARAISMVPDHLTAGALLGSLSLNRGQVREADEIATRLAAAHPDSAVPWTLRGDVEMVRENYAAAAAAFEKASQLDPAQPAYVARRYQALAQSGDAQAGGVLRAWLAQNPDEPSMRLLLAQDLQSRGSNDDAIAEYEALAGRQPDNPVVLNNLAWLYSLNADSRAIPTAERAHAAAPNSGAVTDTLGWLLVQSGDVDRAVPLLREAARQAPEVAEIRYHLAVALARSGEAREAREVLEGLLASGEPFEGRAEAELLLQGL